MKYMIMAIFACQFLYGGEQTSGAFEDAFNSTLPGKIQILLEKDATEALLEIKGSYYLYNPHDGSRISSGILGKRFIIRETENGLKWGESFPGIHQIYICPRSPETSIFVNGIQYSGNVAVLGVNRLINIINEIDIESYVKSILSTHFFTPLEPEVMSSLAILIRTNAYYDVLNNPESFWHTSASTSFGQYEGSALIVTKSPADRAVDMTRNLILVRHSEEAKTVPFPATWTEHSAGKTANYNAIFRLEKDAPDKGVEAPHAALAREDSKWSFTISKRHLSQGLGITDITSIESFVDQPSGKVYALRVKNKENTYDIDFFTLQERIGKNNILSSDFQISLKGENVLFAGYGKGHGVGLCLYSASSLAQNGENAIKILSKFFPETYLYNLEAIPRKR